MASTKDADKDVAYFAVRALESAAWNSETIWTNMYTLITKHY